MAVSLQLDYSLDSSGFFTADRRTLLENTLNAVASRLDDTLTAVPSYTYGVSTSNGSRQVTTSVPANTIKIYPFGDALTGSTVGQGYGIWTVSDNNAMRGQQANDYAPDVGFIQFDDDGSTDWYFGSSTSGLTSNLTDFVSVARHELLHVLGFTSGQPTFDRYLQNSKFVGPNAEAAFHNSPVPMDDSHVASSVTSVMNASSLDGTREDLRDLEWGILKDIGWSVRDAGSNNNLGPYPLYLDFGAAGLWSWSVESDYRQISTSDPEGMAVTNDGTLFVDFGASGVWRWNQGPGFQLISAANPEGMTAGMSGSLFIDFGPYGLWYWRSGVMSQLSAADPEGIVASPDSSLFVDFGPYGLWRWTSGGGLQQVNGANPEGIAIARNGSNYDGSVYLDYGRFGLWRWSAISGLQQLSAADPEGMTAAPDGSLAIDFGAFGLWRWSAPGGFQRLNTANADKVVAGSDGWLYIDFGPSGLWRWNAVGGYQKLHPNNVQDLATA